MLLPLFGERPKSVEKSRRARWRSLALEAESPHSNKRSSTKHRWVILFFLHLQGIQMETLLESYFLLVDLWAMIRPPWQWQRDTGKEDHLSGSLSCSQKKPTNSPLMFTENLAVEMHSFTQLTNFGGNPIRARRSKMILRLAKLIPLCFHKLRSITYSLSKIYVDPIFFARQWKGILS